MNKKRIPLIMMITDLHLSESNLSIIIPIIRDAIDKAKEFGFEHLYITGDVFDSRKAQSLKVLSAFLTILDYANYRSITLRVIPGNHDKPNYKAEESYLDVFNHHSAMQLITTDGHYELFLPSDDTKPSYGIHMIPFFSEGDVYPKYLESRLGELSHYKHNLLLTHVAIDGVRNNDGSEIEDTLSSDRFNLFDKVFVGHYHDYQEVGNVVYFGSAVQKNFGEDVKKGFTVLYHTDDGVQWELIPSKFKPYETIKINLSDTTKKDIDKLRKAHSNSDSNVRFKFIGSREQVKSIDKSTFISLGIDVKVEEMDPDVNVDYVDITEFSGYDKESIKDGWDKFKEDNDDVDPVVHQEGKELLNQIL